MSPKEKIKPVLGRELVKERKNLTRCKQKFACYLPREMDEQNGDSGFTRRQCLDWYKNEVAELEQAWAWLNRPEPKAQSKKSSNPLGSLFGIGGL